MKNIGNNLSLNTVISALLILTAVTAFGKSDFPHYFQCEQICVDMTTKESLQVMTNNINQAQYLINRSCENIGRKAIGEMKCLPVKTSDQNTEAFQACVNGTNTKWWWICQTVGKVYIMKKGTPTQAVTLNNNLSKKSFHEADQVLLRYCKNYQNGFPDAEVICTFLYNEVWKQESLNRFMPLKQGSIKMPIGRGRSDMGNQND